MFCALSELKYLQELRITLSPRIRAPSRLRLQRCCRSEMTTSTEALTKNPFQLLPDELVINIFREIDKRQNSYHDLDILPQSQHDLKNLCLVDKRFSRVASYVLWCAPLLKPFNIKDFETISRKPIQHLDLTNFSYSACTDV